MVVLCLVGSGLFGFAMAVAALRSVGISICGLQISMV